MATLKDLISAQQLQKKDVERLLASAQKMEKSISAKSVQCNNKIVATLFFEPSTRTHSSFAAAAMRLGCPILTFNVANSSIAKGETFEDTIRMFDSYADALVLRHPQAGFAQIAADIASHPVVNAGDGGNEHPTQALIDIYTILSLKKSIKGLNVTLAGDLKHARAMRSLFYLLGMFGANITLASPAGLEMDSHLVRKVDEKFSPQISFSRAPSKESDILYICRIQKERFASPAAAEAAQGSFRIDARFLQGAKKDMAILHPLPKHLEIPPEVDASPHAKYFQQAKYAVPVRMAVLKDMLAL